MSEEPFFLETASGTLRGYVRLKCQGARALVVFLHGWIGYCAGPHRILYEAAHALAQEGFATVRFDFLGRGDSAGNWDSTSFKQSAADVRAVVSFVRRSCDYDKIVMVGLCYGAAVGLSCADLWNRIVVWSPVPPATPPSPLRLIRSLVGNSPKIAQRILGCRRADSTALDCRAIGNAFRYYLSYPKEPYTIKMPLSLPHPVRDAIIFLGANDPNRHRAARVYKRYFSCLGIPCDLRIVYGADHNFSDVITKERLIGYTYSWLCEETN